MAIKINVERRGWVSGERRDKHGIVRELSFAKDCDGGKVYADPGRIETDDVLYYIEWRLMSRYEIRKIQKDDTG